MIVPSSRWLALSLAFLATLALTACGDLPEPFLGNPGATARRLAVPETPMLAVPPPKGALMTADAGLDFANMLARGLRDEEVAALARVPEKYDWRVRITATRNGDTLLPRYTVLDPSGKDLGSIDGIAVPAAGWSSGWPATLGLAARDAAPKILALMTSIRSTRDRTDPNALVNRVAKLFVPEVTGAPGDGNFALTRLIRQQLGQFGPLIQLSPDGADFTVQGQVTASPAPDGQQRIEVVWTVTRPSGVVSGKVSQLHDIPAGSLDKFWGDVAVAVTQEAAGGINTVVDQFIGRGPEKAAAPLGAPSGAPAGAPSATPMAAVSRTPPAENHPGLNQPGAK